MGQLLYTNETKRTYRWAKNRIVSRFARSFIIFRRGEWRYIFLNALFSANLLIQPFRIARIIQYPNARNRAGKSWKIEIWDALLVLEPRNLDDNAQIKSDAEIPGVNRIHGTRSVPEAYNYHTQAFNIELAASQGFLWL